MCPFRSRRGFSTADTGNPLLPELTESKFRSFSAGLSKPRPHSILVNRVCAWMRVSVPHFAVFFPSPPLWSGALPLFNDIKIVCSPRPPPSPRPRNQTERKRNIRGSRETRFVFFDFSFFLPFFVPAPLPSPSPSLSPFFFFFISKRCLHETRRVFEGNVFGQPSEKLR